MLLSGVKWSNLYIAKAFIEESLSPEWIGSTGQGFKDEAAEADPDLGDISC